MKSRTIAMGGVAALLLLATGEARAQSPGPLVTDRPTRTDSPITVPVEHFQLEMDAASYGHFDNADIDIDDFSLAPFNLKYGFTKNVDAQLLFTPYQRIQTTTNGAKDTDNGSGPLGIRFKINFRGNDGDGMGAALLPYIIAPTRGIQKLDYTVFGFSVPVVFPLDGGMSIGAAAGTEWLGSKDTFGIASVVFTSHIAYGWSGFLEFYGKVDGVHDEDIQIVTMDIGAVLAPSDDWSLDAGLYYGISSDAENWRLFAGLSKRK